MTTRPVIHPHATGAPPPTPAGTGTTTGDGVGDGLGGGLVVDLGGGRQLQVAMDDPGAFTSADVERVGKSVTFGTPDLSWARPAAASATEG